LPTTSLFNPSIHAKTGTVPVPKIRKSPASLWNYLAILRSAVYRLLAKSMPNMRVGSAHRFPANQIFGWLELQRVNKLNNRDTIGAKI
jgi:hypothetical protein